MAMQRPDVLDTRVEVAAPENIVFRFRVAGPFQRLVAFLVDVVVRLMAVATVVLFSGLVGAAFGVSGSGGALVGLVLCTWFALDWGYGAILEAAWNGRTIGKRLQGLRVVGIDGRPINAMQAMLRNVLRSADMLPAVPLAWYDDSWWWAPVPICVVGLASAAANRRMQRLGDLAAGTMVILEERLSPLPGSSAAEDARLAEALEDLPIQLAVAPRTAAAIAQYVERRARLAPGRREEVASLLGETLRSRLRIEPTDDRTPLSNDLLLCALHARLYAVGASDPSEAAEEQRPPVEGSAS